MIDLLKANVDDFVSLVELHRFDAVGSSYLDFPQVDDETVMALLKQARHACLPVRAVSLTMG